MGRHSTGLLHGEKTVSVGVGTIVNNLSTSTRNKPFLTKYLCLLSGSKVHDLKWGTLNDNYHMPTMLHSKSHIIPTFLHDERILPYTECIGFLLSFTQHMYVNCQ